MNSVDNDKDEWITVPVLLDHDATRPVGSLTIRRDAIPAVPEFMFSIGYEVTKFSVARERVEAFELKAVSPMLDGRYKVFLDKAQGPHLQGTLKDAIVSLIEKAKSDADPGHALSYATAVSHLTGALQLARGMED